MTKKYLMIAIGLLLIGGQSCKDEEDAPGTGSNNTSKGKLTDADKAKLYDKVWYPTSAAGGVNFEFKTSGNIMRFNKSLDGTWAWINKGDTMNISNWVGEKYKFLIISIGANEMTYRSSQGGDNYKTLSTYRDTE